MTKIFGYSKLTTEEATAKLISASMNISKDMKAAKCLGIVTSEMGHTDAADIEEKKYRAMLKLKPTDSGDGKPAA